MNICKVCGLIQPDECTCLDQAEFYLVHDPAFRNEVHAIMYNGVYVLRLVDCERNSMLAQIIVDLLNGKSGATDALNTKIDELKNGTKTAPDGAKEMTP